MTRRPNGDLRATYAEDKAGAKLKVVFEWKPPSACILEATREVAKALRERKDGAPLSTAAAIPPPTTDPSHWVNIMDLSDDHHSVQLGGSLEQCVFMYSKLYEAGIHGNAIPPPPDLAPRVAELEGAVAAATARAVAAESALSRESSRADASDTVALTERGRADAAEEKLAKSQLAVRDAQASTQTALARAEAAESALAEKTRAAEAAERDAAEALRSAAADLAKMRADAAAETARADALSSDLDNLKAQAADLAAALNAASAAASAAAGTAVISADSASSPESVATPDAVSSSTTSVAGTDAASAPDAAESLEASVVSNAAALLNDSSTVPIDTLASAPLSDELASLKSQLISAQEALASSESRASAAAIAARDALAAANDARASSESEAAREMLALRAEVEALKLAAASHVTDLETALAEERRKLATEFDAERERSAAVLAVALNSQATDRETLVAEARSAAARAQETSESALAEAQRQAADHAAKQSDAEARAAASAAAQAAAEQRSADAAVALASALEALAASQRAEETSTASCDARWAPLIESAHAATAAAQAEVAVLRRQLDASEYAVRALRAAAHWSAEQAKLTQQGLRKTLQPAAETCEEAAVRLRSMREGQGELENVLAATHAAAVEFATALEVAERDAAAALGEAARARQEVEQVSRWRCVCS